MRGKHTVCFVMDAISSWLILPRAACSMMRRALWRSEVLLSLRSGAVNAGE